MLRISLMYVRLWLIMVLLVLVSVSTQVGVLAQEYPSKPIRWIVPYPPGGTSDFLARLIGQKLTEAWRQPVVVDNRSGAAGNIGTDAAAKAAADGYTMLLVTNTFAINPSIYPKLPFDSEKDFAPVTMLLWQPYILVTHPSLGTKSVRQLIDLARASPGKVNYGSGGVGTAGQISMELFLTMAGVKMTHVPYRGMGPAILALIQGEVYLMFAASAVVTPYLKQGKLRALGVSGRTRSAALPEVPTISEAGVTGYEEGNWQGLLVPSQTPPSIVTKLNQEVVRILRTAEITEQLRRIGADVIANTSDEFAAVIRADLKKYADLVRAAGIRLD